MQAPYCVRCEKVRKRPWSMIDAIFDLSAANLVCSTSGYRSSNETIHTYPYLMSSCSGRYNDTAASRHSLTAPRTPALSRPTTLILASSAVETPSSFARRNVSQPTWARTRHCQFHADFSLDKIHGLHGQNK